MTPEIFIKRSLKASFVTPVEELQSLWSGYGSIVRYNVSGSDIADSAVLKSIRLTKSESHPRGWNSDFAHQRKQHSYQVEANWYKNWAYQCDSDTKVATLYGHFHENDILYLLFEDLDASGFDCQYSSLTVAQAPVVLSWLANFHARFIHFDADPYWPEGLWERGTYWHLSTRPEEWKAMAEGVLKNKAYELDTCLQSARYQTLVHGDAKVANFCFSEHKRQVAAVDFQYVGRGVGVQDVVYFLGSCLREDELEQHLDYLLSLYFAELNLSLLSSGESPDFAEAVCKEWEELLYIAWADFHRFLMGWAPTHKKNTNLSHRMMLKGLKSLELMRP